MNERLLNMKQRVRAGEHRALRQTAPIDVLTECEARELIVDAARGTPGAPPV